MRLAAYAVHTCPKGADRQPPRRALRILLGAGTPSLREGEESKENSAASVRPVRGGAFGGRR